MADKSLAELLWESVDALAELAKTRKCAICGGNNALTLLMYLYKGRCYAGYFCPKCGEAIKRLVATDVIFDEGEQDD